MSVLLNGQQVRGSLAYEKLSHREIRNKISSKHASLPLSLIRVRNKLRKPFGKTTERFSEVILIWFCLRIQQQYRRNSPPVIHFFSFKQFSFCHTKTGLDSMPSTEKFSSPSKGGSFCPILISFFGCGGYKLMILRDGDSASPRLFF